MDARSHEARHRQEVAVPARRRARRIASHHALYERVDRARCDVCDRLLLDVGIFDEPIAGEAGQRADGAPLDDDAAPRAGAGLYLWTRGAGSDAELRFEDAPLCARCGPAIAITAMRRWQLEDEEEG